MPAAVSRAEAFIKYLFPEATAREDIVLTLGVVLLVLTGLWLSVIEIVWLAGALIVCILSALVLVFLRVTVPYYGRGRGPSTIDAPPAGGHPGDALTRSE